jgi:hypothetical protein
MDGSGLLEDVGGHERACGLVYFGGAGKASDADAQAA